MDGYSEGLRDGRQFTKTSSGPPKSRRRYSSAAMPVQAAIVISYAQKSRLERFWNEDTAGGSLPFILPDQTHDGLAFMSGSGEISTSGGVILIGFYKWLVMFADGESPKFTPFGVQFQASFSLSVMP